MSLDASYGADYLAEFFTNAYRGTFIDAGAGQGAATIAVAREEFVSCKAIEPDPRHFDRLASNVKNHCPNGNVEVINGPVDCLDALLPTEDLCLPLAVRIADTPDHESVIAGAGRLLSTAGILVLRRWPHSPFLSDRFSKAAIATEGTDQLDWQALADLRIPEDGDFEIILRQ